MNTPLRTSKNKKSLRTTPYGNRTHSSGCNAPFKSPVINKSGLCGSISSPITPTNKERKDSILQQNASLNDVSSLDPDKNALRAEVAAIKEQIEEQNLKIKNIEAANVNKEESITQIEKLHEYNELKDVAQMIMGKLAEMEGTTTKEMYAKFDLEFED